MNLTLRVLLYLGLILLVVEDDVGPPDVVGRDVETLHSPVLLGVPHQLVISPELLNPQIGCHNLILQILKRKKKHSSSLQVFVLNNQR